MSSWVSPDTYTGVPGLQAGSLIEINGYKIRKPNRFRNLAHERAFEIALVLAQKKSVINYSQRMGTEVIHITSPVIMTTSECIDAIMFNGIPEIQLKLDAVNPQKVALDAMKFVPSFFDPGTVRLEQRKKGKKIWYLESLHNLLL